jgi:hypothetical protein
MFLLCLCTTLPALAGEQLSVRDRLRESHSVAMVQVSLSGKTETVSVEKVLWGDTITADSSWLGLCLPAKATLAQWQKSHNNDSWPVSLWKKVAKSKGYRAVVFLKKYGSESKPFCGVESMRLQHTDSSDAWSLFLETLELATPKP